MFAPVIIFQGIRVHRHAPPVRLCQCVQMITIENGYGEVRGDENRRFRRQIAPLSFIVKNRSTCNIDVR